MIDWLINFIDLKTNSVQSYKSLIYNLTNRNTSIKILKHVNKENTDIKLDDLSQNIAFTNLPTI